MGGQSKIPTLSNLWPLARELIKQNLLQLSNPNQTIRGHNFLHKKSIRFLSFNISVLFFRSPKKHATGQLAKKISTIFKQLPKNGVESSARAGKPTQNTEINSIRSEFNILAAMSARILVSAPLKNQNEAEKLTRVWGCLNHALVTRHVSLSLLILISFIFPQEIKLNVACNMIAMEPHNRMRLANCRKRAIRGHHSIAALLRKHQPRWTPP